MSQLALAALLMAPRAIAGGAQALNPANRQTALALRPVIAQIPALRALSAAREFQYSNLGANQDPYLALVNPIVELLRNRAPAGEFFQSQSLAIIANSSEELGEIVAREYANFNAADIALENEQELRAQAALGNALAAWNDYMSDGRLDSKTADAFELKRARIQEVLDRRAGFNAKDILQEIRESERSPEQLENLRQALVQLNADHRTLPTYSANARALVVLHIALASAASRLEIPLESALAPWKLTHRAADYARGNPGLERLLLNSLLDNVMIRQGNHFLEQALLLSIETAQDSVFPKTKNEAASLLRREEEDPGNFDRGDVLVRWALEKFFDSSAKILERKAAPRMVQKRARRLAKAKLAGWIAGVNALLAVAFGALNVLFFHLPFFPSLAHDRGFSATHPFYMYVACALVCLICSLILFAALKFTPVPYYATLDGKEPNR